MQACFPVNFAKFLRTLFIIKHLWWVLQHTKLIMIETELFLSCENPMSMPWIRFSRNKMSMNSYKQSNLLFRDQRQWDHCLRVIITKCKCDWQYVDIRGEIFSFAQLRNLLRAPVIQISLANKQTQVRNVLFKYCVIVFKLVSRYTVPLSYRQKFMKSVD